MDISLKWINRYLSPSTLTADEADSLLTQAGFPVEQRRLLANGDEILDVEVTSNRGDCLSHIGCAREVAAMRPAHKPSATPNQPSPKSRYQLKLPEFRDPPAHGPVGDHLILENRQHDVCPLFTARVIRNCQLGPSPDWLIEALEAVGQRSVNNVVDVTNFITLEFGNPCHVFDLHKLQGQQLIIRYAKQGEKLTTLDGKQRTLQPTDLVVADRDNATSLAGVMGGQASEVDESTTDVVFEMATWNPVTVRNAARRLAIRTDASYRFERGVHPATIDLAARRAVALICELTGGQLCEGVLAEGAPIPEPARITLRPSRVQRIVGVHASVSSMIAMLRDLDIEVEQTDDDALACVVPPDRLDLTREIDLVEEIARAQGLDAVPNAEKLAVRPRPLQATEQATREIARVLTGLGFYETVTFTFVGHKEAELFLPQNLELVAVDDERRKSEPVLRPSVLCGLLACRKGNRDHGVERPGGLRLYELAQAFAQDHAQNSREARTLGLLMDVQLTSKKPSPDDLQHGVRLLRGAIDSVLRAMFGPHASIAAEPAAPQSRAWNPRAHATITLHNTIEIARFGLLSEEALNLYDLQHPIAAAELLIDPMLAAFPPPAVATRLPSFPGIERDLSLILPEQTPWARVEQLVHALGLEKMTACRFVGTFRGKQIGAGRKSVTVRLSFQDPDRTLRHEEVDPQMQRLAEAARNRLNAEIRT